MKSYDRKIKSIQAKIRKKGEQLYKIETEYKRLKKEYNDYCDMEVRSKYEIGQILVYEVNEQYRDYYKTIFVYGGVSKHLVEKYGNVDLPSNCCVRLGNAPICSTYDYEKIRPANKEEINKFVNYLLTEAYCEQIEKYYDILVKNGVKDETLDELIWSKKKRNK